MPSLSSLFGQRSAVGSVRRALTAGSLPGSYLFVGPPGIGKGALARATAQAAACLQLDSESPDACGVCDSCRRAEDGAQPEIVTILPAGEQTQIWQFWERDNHADSGVLTRTINYAPVIGQRRVYIIERAETLTEPAANSLLKVLEEPPPYVLFILAAPHPARVLPTIVSRSQMVRLSPVPRTELESYLEHTFSLDCARAGLYAALAEGKIGQAVRLAQAPKVSEEINKVLDFAESIPDAPPLRALKISEQMRKLAGQMKAIIGEEASAVAAGSGEGSDGGAKEKTSRRQLAAVFDMLVVFYRDLMALSVGAAAANTIMNRERADACGRLAMGSTADRWASCLDGLMMARRRLDANASIVMITDVLALDLVRQVR